MTSTSDERARELSTLLDIARDLSSTLELAPLLDSMLSHLHKLVDYDGAGVEARSGDEFVTMALRRPSGVSQSEGLGTTGSFARAPTVWDGVRQGRAVIIDDVQGESELAAEYRASVGTERLATTLSYIRSWMSVPMVHRDRVIGLLTLASRTPGRFTARDAELARAVAAQAAVAFVNARLYAQSEQRARELSALLRVAHNLSSTLELPPLLDLILDQLRQVIPYQGATIGIIEGDEIYVAGSRAVTPEREADKGMRAKLANAEPLASTILGGRAVIIDDMLGDSPEARAYRAVNAGWMERPTHRDIRSWMAVPLMVKDRVIGQLAASQDVPAYFTSGHAELARAFANHAAVAIENARLYEQAQRAAAMQERQRLARDLHDSVSQALYGIGLGTRTARAWLDRDPRRAVEPLEYVLSLAQAGQAEMRALLFELRPESLEEEGLVAALEKQVAALRARHGIEVGSELGGEPAVTLSVKEALYRVAQEAMHNTVKHAHATRVAVRLHTADGAVVLGVEDDGAGFDAGGSFPGHLGLRSMRERAERVGGSLRVESEPGRGARVTMVVPAVGSPLGA